MSRMLALAGIVIAGLASVAAVRAQADTFADGLAAYDGGDYAETLRIWQQLADQDDPRAQTALAGLYLSGEGVRPDPARAAALYRRAAEQGDDDAQLNLGRLYLDGVGVPRDLVQGYAWLSLAAAQGRAWAERRRVDLATTMSAAQLAAAEEQVRAFRPR